MESSSVRKIYVDSRRKTPGSQSTSDFEFELNRSITLPRKCVAFVTDIHLPHSWYNVDSHAQHLYLVEHFDEPHVGGGTASIVRRVTLAAGHRTGTSLAADLQTELQDLTVMPDHTWTCTYSALTGKIEIACTHNLGLTHIVSLGASTGSVWNVYSDDVTLMSQRAVTRTGLLTYEYVQGGFLETLTVSQIDAVARTFRVVSSTGQVFIWNDALQRLDVTTSTWNWRPDGFIINFDQLQNHFEIYTDNQLETPSVQALFSARGISYGQRSPASINHLLCHTGHGATTKHDWGAGSHGSFHSGVLDLTGQSPPLFIVSPNMTAFGTSQGPLGEHTIMRCICPNDASYGGFGGHIIDTLQNEQDYFVCGGSTLKNLRFQLITITGQSVNLNGADWSFSIIFQDMAT